MSQMASRVPADPVDLSVVIPVYNEADVLDLCLSKVQAVLSEAALSSWEVIVVDDGSSDDTRRLIKEAAERDPRIRAILLSRNFGHQAAITAGLIAATGEAVAIIDADLQDPPELLPQMLKKLKEGYDVAYGIRTDRKEGALRKLGYRWYYRLASSISEGSIPRNAGDFCVMSRRAVDELNQLPERRRYVRGLRSWLGFGQIGIPYGRAARARGRSAYTWTKLAQLAESGFVSTSRIPLKASSYMGLSLAGLGFLWAAKVLLFKLVYGSAPSGFTTLMIAVLVLGGAQLISVGILGFYLGRVLDQVENRPDYVIEKTYNLDPNRSRLS